MKRGPDHSEKATQCNPSFAQVALGIPEIVATILHHYPRYGLRGQNNLVTVFTVWHEALKQCHLQDEPTFEKLMVDCLKNPEGVIHILSDDTLLPYLSEEQLLKLISCHSEFAISLFENGVLPINQKNLLSLTKHHAQVAMHLFTNPKWFEKIKNNIYEFGCQHLEIAHHILDNNFNVGEVRRNGLKSLAESSVTIARRLLNDPATFRELTEPDLKGPKFLYQYLELLIEAAKTNESFGFLPSGINTPNDFINQFEALCEPGLTTQEVEVLGEYHSEIAMKVLQSKTLREKHFDQESCSKWGENHQAVALCLLKEKTLDAYRVGELCTSHPAALEYVLNDRDLWKLMCALACASRFMSGCLPLDKIAMHILKTSVLCEKLYDDALVYDGALLMLGQRAPQAAKVFLTTKEFYTKLSKESIYSICHRHPHIHRQILNTQSLRKVLEPEHLKTLESIDSQLLIKSLLIKVSEQAKCWDLQTNKPRVDVVAKVTLKRSRAT